MDNVEFLQEMQVLHLEPGDALIFKCRQPLSEEVRRRLVEFIHSKIGEVPVIILDDGQEIGVLRQSAGRCGTVAE